MIAYFTASIVGKKQYISNYTEIIKTLEARHIKVLSEHILKTSENEIQLETREKRLEFQDKLDLWISQADFMVAEVSFPSISVGYEISLALHHGKPVLVLYSNGHPPSLLAQHRDEKLVCEHYSLQSLAANISDFLNYVDGATDTRFTFFITPAQNSYLEHKAKSEKLPKSVYLRKLIESDMKGLKKASFACPFLQEHDSEHTHIKEDCYFCKQKAAND